MQRLLPDVLQLLVCFLHELLLSVQLGEDLDLLLGRSELVSEHGPALLEFVEPDAENLKVVPSILLPEQLSRLREGYFHELRCIQDGKGREPNVLLIRQDERHNEADDRDEDEQAVEDGAVGAYLVLAADWVVRALDELNLVRETCPADLLIVDHQDGWPVGDTFLHLLHDAQAAHAPRRFVEKACVVADREDV